MFECINVLHIAGVAAGGAAGGGAAGETMRMMVLPVAVLGGSVPAMYVYICIYIYICAIRYSHIYDMCIYVYINRER